VNLNAFNATALIDQDLDGKDPTSTRPFNGVVRHAYFTVNGTLANVKVGITGGVVDPAKSMARVLNTTATFAAIKAECALMKQEGANIIVALMHQAIADDSNLAAQIPEIDIIVGGHEHDNYAVYRSARNVPVYRADANARTVYVHDLFYNTTSGKLKIQSRLQHINDGFADDAVVGARVKYWTDAAFEGFRLAGFNASKVVGKLTVSFNVLDSYVRAFLAPIGYLVSDAMLNYPAVKATGAQFCLLNGGAFRLDDIMESGNITQYGVLRMLPFVNGLQVWNISTVHLIAALDEGFASSNQGTGGFLQVSSNYRGKVGGFHGIHNGVNTVLLFPNSTDVWTVVSIDFLWNSGTGASKNNLNNTRIDYMNSAVSKGDQRNAVIDYLALLYPL
jgi:5'-nucleotidase